MNDSFELDAINFPVAESGVEAEFDLLAFCYLNDELSPAAKNEFELCLATEQPAREALARVVALQAVLAGAKVSPASLTTGTQSPVIRPFDRWMQTTAWLAIASAACLAVVIGLQSVPGFWHASDTLSPETALVWSQVRDSWPDSAVSEVLSLPLPAPEAVAAVDAAEQPDMDENSEMPPWLLAAVGVPNDEELETPADVDSNSDEREEL